MVKWEVGWDRSKGDTARCNGAFNKDVEGIVWGATGLVASVRVTKISAGLACYD